MTDAPAPMVEVDGPGPAPTRAQRRAMRGADGPPSAASTAEREVAPDPNPDGGGRRAAARARRRARAERRRFWLITMPAIVLALAILVGIGVVLRGNEDDVSGGSGAAELPALQTTAALVGHTSIDGTTDLLILLGRTSNDGSVLLLPGATQVEVPSLGIQTLGQVSALGTNDLLTTTVQNLTGLRAGAPVLGGDAQLAAALAPAAPLDIDLPNDVIPKGSSRPETTAGPHRASVESAVRLLTVEEEGSEVDHLVTVQAVLSAWFERLRDPQVAAATRRAAPELAPPLIEVANTGTPSFDTLPVDSIGTSGDERLRVRSAAMPGVSERMFPDARLGIDGSRPRVEILNGVGTVGLAQAVAARIVPVGADVRLTGNWPGFGISSTQVVYYRDRDRNAAQVILDAVGVGSLRKARRAVGITDVTIVVGSDFAPKAPAS
jgi:hypothetical protein